MEPYYEDSHIKIFNKDCRSMEELSDESIDLLVTDPPYGISFMGKDWDTFNEVVEPQRAYQHKKGFKKLPRQNTISMTEFFIPIWRECLRILKPGAFAFVMCSPRTDVMAKQVSCLQEAGFEVGFTPIYWAYASGFPKAQNIGKAVDKRLGVKREVVGETQWIDGSKRKALPKKATVDYAGGWQGTGYGLPITKGDSPLEGSYGGFQPKPAVEVIIVAMKPLSEKTYVDQALKDGKGITWLDDGRIPYQQDETVVPFQYEHSPKGYGYKDRPRGGYGGMKIVIGKPEEHQEYHGERECNPQGRFPANLLVSDDALNDGKLHSSGEMDSTAKRARYNTYGQMYERRVINPASSGSFSRYFDLDKWWEERIKELPEAVQRTFPFLVVPKASKSEKNRGCEDLEKHKPNYADYRPNYKNTRGGDTPYAGTNRGGQMRNYHPTVKPLKLMSYLTTLGSREGDTVVDPFIGTGSTAIACQILGRRCTGYEINSDYCEIAKGRLSWCWQQVMDLSKAF